MTDLTPFERIGGQPTVDRIDAWMLCMRRAMEEVVTDEAAREWILQKLSPLADWMRNRPAAGG
jgi:truncated hemoglobin YjbI